MPRGGPENSGSDTPSAKAQAKSFVDSEFFCHNLLPGRMNWRCASSALIFEIVPQGPDVSVAKAPERL
jgi:hypothetical protein